MRNIVNDNIEKLRKMSPDAIIDGGLKTCANRELFPEKSVCVAHREG